MTLPAVCLLDQYRLPSGDVLLVLDEDVPYEEQMHLALVRGTSVLDHLTLGAPYATGAYRKIATEGTSLRFSFAGPDVLTATVLDRGTRIPPRLPAGAHRRGRWLGKHYLVVTTLGARGINVQAISTSEIELSVLIDEDETELAVRVPHTAYGLDTAA